MVTRSVHPELPQLSGTSLEELQRECNELADAGPEETQKIAALMLRMILRYYADVRNQARQSFYSALAAAVVGSGFFIWTAHVAGDGDYPKAALAAIAGTLVQVISGVNFYLYFKVSKLFGGFHICLERTNRFLLANTFCENIAEPSERDAVRAALVKIVADAPMLTMDIISGELSHAKGIRKVESGHSRSDDHYRARSPVKEVHDSGPS